MKSESFNKSFAKSKKKIQDKKQNYYSKRTHRSFQLSRRRDYKREMHLPGYIALTRDVNKVLSKNRGLFARLILFYSVATALFVGMASQDLYSTISDTLRTTGDEIFSGSFGQIGEAGLLLLTGVTGSMTQSLNETQQVFASLLAITIWLTTVWLIRNRLAAKQVNLRDGLYNAMSPLISTILVSLLLMVQLLPIALAFIGYTAAAVSGLLDNGVESMLFWFVAITLVVLSLYLMTSTFMALIVVTLPGMYPLNAIRAGGDIVSGRRLRILYRVLWMGLLLVMTWLIIMVPIIIFDSWIKGLLPLIDWLPIVPMCLLLLSSATVVWMASYVYVLYRKIVDDAAKSA